MNFSRHSFRRGQRQPIESEDLGSSGILNFHLERVDALVSQ